MSANTSAKPSGSNHRTIGPELGIGNFVGDFTDGTVLILKSCIGNLASGWDLPPPGSDKFVYTGSCCMCVSVRCSRALPPRLRESAVMVCAASCSLLACASVHRQDVQLLLSACSGLTSFLRLAVTSGRCDLRGVCALALGAFVARASLVGSRGLSRCRSVLCPLWSCFSYRCIPACVWLQDAMSHICLISITLLSFDH